MIIENNFDVPAPIDVVWNYLLDVERVVPCMPGARLTEVVDDKTWKGKVTVKVGPVSLSFAGKITMQERDDEHYRVVLRGQGMEQRGKGAASATITSTLERADGVTKVKVVQDLKVQGQAAQFSRGMMQDVSAKLTRQFADCLRVNMAAQESAPAAAETSPELSGAPAAPVPQIAAKPVSGIGLLLSALGSAITRFFKRLIGHG